MIELVDQSNPNALVFRCDLCGKSFDQPNYAALDLHMPPHFYTPSTRDQARKARIPACEPAPVKPEPVADPEPKAKVAK